MKSNRHAFTLVELIVVLAICGLLAACLVPALSSTKSGAQRLTCMNNLKQDGLALRTWSADHGGKYPMALTQVNGGSGDVLAHASGNVMPTAPVTGVYCAGFTYMVLSNRLTSPKVCYCPADDIHTAGFGYATNFTFPEFLGIATPAAHANINSSQTGSSKISYFINADASEANPQDIMMGDDNIGNIGATTAATAPTHRFGIVSGASDSYSGAMNIGFCAGIVNQAWNGSPWFSWTAHNFHQRAGNLAFADGSCQFASISQLHSYLSNSTNSVIGEALNFMP